MNLDQLRTDIDKIDRQLLDLFVNRMRLCQQVQRQALPMFVLTIRPSVKYRSLMGKRLNK